MNNYENDIFTFSGENNEQTFDYNSLSGLGQSNYENEDLFSTEVKSF